MASRRLLRTLGPSGPHPSPLLGRSRQPELPGVLGHLMVMKTEKIRDTSAKAPTRSMVMADSGRSAERVVVSAFR